MPEIGIYIPSYNRAGSVTTLDYLPTAKIAVPESQTTEYARHYPPDSLFPVPDSRDGSVSRKRNAILDLAPEDYIVQVDDDLQKVISLPGKEEVRGDRLYRLIVEGFVLASGFGAGLWGMNWNANPLHYRDYVPYSLTKPFFQFLGIIRSEIRCDERVRRGEDVDLWLQHAKRDRVTFRWNRYVPICHYMKSGQAGGIEKATSRTDAEYLTRKWGSLVKIKPDGHFGLPSTPVRGT